MAEHDANTLIVGAGPAGLAVGACLRRAGIAFLILEREDRVGAVWHRHYDRLHLHTDKGHSALPFAPFGPDYPRYPSRREFIRYLEDYARRFGIDPIFGAEVRQVSREGDGWATQAGECRYHARNLVIATGYNRQPNRPTWPGQGEFRGPVAHSSEYRNGEPYRGRRVLVVGFGNSGGEIALDLWEHGARPALAVRGPVNVIPREVLGVPILTLAILLAQLPPSLAERLDALSPLPGVGSYARLGLRRSEVGPMTQIARRRRVPLIDVGTTRLIREGHVAVYPGVERYTPEGVRFDDGRLVPFDAVILATGYRPAAAEFLGETAEALDADGIPRVHGAPPALPGLYFCGFHVAPTGALREIAIEARAIARDITAA